MLQQGIDSVRFLNTDIEIGPVTLALFGTVIVVVLFVLGEYFVRWILAFGRSYKATRDLTDPYNRYYYLVAFIVFFALSFMAKINEVRFDDPIMMLVSVMILFSFLGWSLVSDRRTMVIIIFAILGSIFGDVFATII